MRRCFFQVLQQRKSTLLKPLVAPRVYYTTTSVPRRLPVLAERTSKSLNKKKKKRVSVVTHFLSRQQLFSIARPRSC